MDAYRFESVATRTASDAALSGRRATYLPGEVVADRYKLTRELGRGGMGVVWAAHSLALGVEVAIKLIPSDVASSAVSARMAREAQAAARLSHPALVRVFDFGFTSRNHPYLVMELVQGETLRMQLERDGALPAIEAVKILLPIADGLRAAHDRGIVHRDLKPDNILVARDGLNRVQPKLFDFGIAKDATNDDKITRAGCVIGTPHYISPEQAKGLDSVDARSDVWSLCVVLYELMTGRLPFEEDNYNAQLLAIIERPPAQPPRRTGDTRLWQIVLRGLAKDLDERWQNIGQLGEALALWLCDHGVKADACGNSLRAVWLDNIALSSFGRYSKPLRLVKPTMGSGQSRIPPRRGNTLRGVGLVLAVAASVFGLFELTFAPTTRAEVSSAVQVVSQQQALTTQAVPTNLQKEAMAQPQQASFSRAKEAVKVNTNKRGAQKRKNTATKVALVKTGAPTTQPARTNSTNKALRNHEPSKNKTRLKSGLAARKTYVKKTNVSTIRHDFGF